MTENMKDSFVKAISDRLSNQLLVAFCISWCVVNFNFFIAIFKVADFSQFVKIVSSDIFSEFSTNNAYLCLNFECGQWFYSGIFLPSVLALLYVFLSPFSRLVISNYHQWHDAWLRKTQNYWDDNFVVIRSDWNGLKSRNAELLKKLDAAIEELNAMRVTVGSLREQNDELMLKISEMELSPARDAVQVIGDNLMNGGGLAGDSEVAAFKVLASEYPLVRDIFKFIYESNGRINTDLLRNRLGVNGVDMAHAINILDKNGYVTLGRGDIRFSSKGIDAAVGLFSSGDLG